MNWSPVRCAEDSLNVSTETDLWELSACASCLCSVIVCVMYLPVHDYQKTSMYIQSSNMRLTIPFSGKFKLRDLLAVPMQRILKYHLLLRELMSNTAQSHEEAKTIQSAYEAMLDVSDYINEVCD